MKQVFRGGIALLLLGLYVWLVYRAFKVASCLADSSCKTYTAADFNDVMARTLATVGGLVSALVISELAIATPGSAPAVGSLLYGLTGKKKSVAIILAVLYVVAWITVGLGALVFSLHYPTTLSPLVSLGQAWLGLAVAAAYGYFGLKPPGNEGAADHGTGT